MHTWQAWQKPIGAIAGHCFDTQMHVRCNQIHYNVSKGLAALNAEALTLVWHSVGSWQGQRTRCSSDVAGVWREEREGQTDRDNNH